MQAIVWCAYVHAHVCVSIYMYMYNTCVLVCITCMAVYALYVCAYVLYSACICNCVSVHVCVWQ